MFIYCTLHKPVYSFCHQEQLSELNIPKMSIDASRKIRTVQRQLLNKIQPLVTNRESLLQKCQPISYSLAQKLLFSSYKLHSAFGCWDPIKVGIYNGYYFFHNVLVDAITFL